LPSQKATRGADETLEKVKWSSKGGGGFMSHLSISHHTGERKMAVAESILSQDQKEERVTCPRKFSSLPFFCRYFSNKLYLNYHWRQNARRPLEFTHGQSE